MNKRLLIVLAAFALCLTACSGGDDDVPNDQPIQPQAAPSDWNREDLGAVTVSAPAEWTQEPVEESEGFTKTLWRGAQVDGIADGGLEVTVIDSPTQSTQKQAKSLAISAMAMLKSGKVEPVEVAWPQAEDAYYLEYESQITHRPGTGDNPAPVELDEPLTMTTRTLVLGLADGTQVQVTSLSANGSSLPDQAVASTTVKESTSS